MKNMILFAALLGALTSFTLAAEEAEEIKTENLSGRVVKRSASVKSFEAWNAPSDPYYVLEILLPGVKGRGDEFEYVTLRPSATVKTEDLSKLAGRQATLQGHRTAGEIYKPEDEFESFPVELEEIIAADGTIKTVSRPARRGSGFVVTKIVK